MHTFTQLFLLMFVLSIGLRLWLSSRQITHIRRHRSEVPDSFADKITLEEHQKAADYTPQKLVLAACRCFMMLACCCSGRWAAVWSGWINQSLRWNSAPS